MTDNDIIAEFAAAVRANKNMKRHIRQSKREYNLWKRLREKGLLCPAWQHSYDEFFWGLRDELGFYPYSYPTSRLQRLDESALYGPDNVAWETPYQTKIRKEGAS